METKPFWASKTLWINLIAMIAAITGAFGMDLGLDPTMQAALVTGIMAAINIILRFVTAPVTLTDQRTSE